MGALLKQSQVVAARFEPFEEGREDEKEARSLCWYVENQKKVFWCPGNDKILFVFLGVLYLARLPVKEREALLRDLQCRHKVDEFDLVVEFSTQLNDRFGLEHDPDEDAGELLQDLWQRFCESKGARAARRHIRGLDMEERPRKPLRAAPPFDFGREEGCSTGAGKPDKVAVVLTGAVLPDIFDVVCNLVQSDYFFYLPVDNLGWNLRHAVSTYTRLRDTVEELYSQLEGDPHALPKALAMEPFPGFEMPVSPFRIGEAKLLLRGIRSNELLRSLVLQRPPNSTLPHYYTLVNATAHARLWLGRYDLRIYCDHTLTYGQLCAIGSAPAEREALNNGFLVERGPSIVEDTLRELTLYEMWSDDDGDNDKLLNMRPEDYEPIPEAAAKMDKPLYEALRQLGKPQLVRPPVDTTLASVVAGYAPQLPLETAAKRNFLFREHGMPRHFDKLLDYPTVVMLCDLMKNVCVKNL